jgi:hypothetical protein
MTLAACTTNDRAVSPAVVDSTVSEALNVAQVEQGRDIFRFDTFGDETFWTDTLQMHQVIGTAVSPATALAVGLKVDWAALPPAIRLALETKQVDLDDPAITVALISLNAVVGIKGVVDSTSRLTRVGITCALCHSTVDNSFAPGIGRRLDGWPNRDLDVGKIVALSPALTPAQKAIYNSWGPGLYDPRLNVDGKNIPVVLPPAFGLRHVAKETYTADGPVSYWNDYVAVTQMHGHGQFIDPRIGVSITNPPEMVEPKLPSLRAYQLSIAAPAARKGTYDAIAADRGRAVFRGAGKCATCHFGVAYTDVNEGKLHAPTSVGQDAAYAMRTATQKYRTTPLRGLWNPPQLDGPYFHDGSAPTLAAVVDHYVTVLGLTLTTRQKADLVEYLKTL